MKETKTAKGAPECPTLLHYVARVLLRHDPSLVTFIEDVPHVEAAARGESRSLLEPHPPLTASPSSVCTNSGYLGERLVGRVVPG